MGLHRDRCVLLYFLPLIFVLISPYLHVSAVPVSLYGSGGTTVQQVMGLITQRLNSLHKVSIKYNPVGSGAGRLDFINRAAQFIETDVPMSASEESRIRGQVKFTLPFVVQTVSLFTFIPGFPSIHLTAGVLAAIYQGQITTWDHPSIRQLNPRLLVSPKQQIHVVVRKDVSGSTQLFTGWLSVATRSAWKLGVSGNPRFPAKFIKAQGSTGVAAALRATPFSIGYVGTSVGIALGLHEAYVRNIAGTYLLASRADPYSAIPRPTPNPMRSWAGVSLLNVRGKQTWPITSFAYIIVRKNAVGLGARGGLLVSFLRYLMSKEGQAIATKYDFFQLPLYLKVQNLNYINTIQLAKGVRAPF